MSDTEPPATEVALDAEPPHGVRARIRAVFGGSRDIVRLGWRDPEHIPERLTLYASQRLGEQSREWAVWARSEHGDADRELVSEQLRTRTAYIARVDGAISGTPFFLALVPGYASYLWQEARMTLRIAALYEHDPGKLETQCEMLALRGVHPDVETAREAILAVPPGMPDKPEKRRTLGTWVRAVRSVLVFGGFMSAATADEANRRFKRLRTGLSVAFGLGLWVFTWIFPLSFMVAMAWGCESHARQLGRRAMLFYGGEDATIDQAIADARERHDHGHSRRQVVRSALLALTVIVPMAFVVYANHIRNTVGVNWVGALGALVALALVMALAVVGSRR